MAKHKFEFQQLFNAECTFFEGRAEVLAKLPGNCAIHDLPRYGCAAGDTHFTCCEAMMKPITTTQKRSLN